MGGQSAAKGNRIPRRFLHTGRSGRSHAADVPRAGEPGSGSGIHGAASGSGWVRSMGSAQQRWPGYNQFISRITGAAITATAIAVVVIRAVKG